MLLRTEGWLLIRQGGFLRRGGGFLRTMWRSLRSSTPSRRPSQCWPDLCIFLVAKFLELLGFFPLFSLESLPWQKGSIRKRRFVHNMFLQQSDGYPLEFVLKGCQTELRTIHQNCKNKTPKTGNKQNQAQTGVPEKFRNLGWWWGGGAEVGNELWGLTGRRGHHKRGLFTGGISRISKFARISREWSDSPLFSTVWAFSKISRISKLSRKNSRKWSFLKGPLFPLPN